MVPRAEVMMLGERREDEPDMVHQRSHVHDVLDPAVHHACLVLSSVLAVIVGADRIIAGVQSMYSFFTSVATTAM